MFPSIRLQSVARAAAAMFALASVVPAAAAAQAKVNMYSIAYGGGQHKVCNPVNAPRDATGWIPNEWEVGCGYEGGGALAKASARNGQMRVASLVTSSWHVPVGASGVDYGATSQAYWSDVLSWSAGAGAPSFVEFDLYLHGGMSLDARQPGTTASASVEYYMDASYGGRLMGFNASMGAGYWYPSQPRQNGLNVLERKTARVDVRNRASLPFSLLRRGRQRDHDAELRVRAGHAAPDDGDAGAGDVRPARRGAARVRRRGAAAAFGVTSAS